MGTILSLGVIGILGFYVWHWVNDLGQIAVSSPNARYKVAMMAPSLWQRMYGEVHVPTTLTLTDTEDFSHIQIYSEASTSNGLHQREGEPELIWWRKDSKGFIFISGRTGERYQSAAYEIQNSPLTVKEARWSQWGNRTLIPTWPLSLIREKNRNGTLNEKAISKQFIDDWENVLAYIKNDPELRRRHQKP